MIEFIKPEFEHIDERGYLKQLINKGWKQVNVIYSEKNVVRGGHFHKQNQEMFYIIKGAFKLILSKNGIIKEYNIKTGDMFIIKENVRHTFEYKENTTLIAFYNNGVIMENGKDIYT